MKNFKNIFAAVTAGVICAVGLPWARTAMPGGEKMMPEMEISADAEEIYSYGNLKYTFLLDDTIGITGCDENATELVIPSEIDGVAVTTIASTNGDGAFAGNTSLTSVTIQEGLKGIGGGAFWHCTNLTTVNIPDSVTYIDWGAFADCTSLTSITIPDSVTYVNGGAFDNTPFINRQDGVKYAGNWVVDCDADVTAAEIKEGTKGIASCAFFGYTNLTSVSIPSSVAFICNDAFNGTDLLDNQTGVKYVDDWVVGCDSDVTTAEIKEGTKGIACRAFSYCTGLTEITIPDSVTSIGENAFLYCTSLTGIAVSENNIAFSSVDGVLFDKTQTKLIYYPVGKTDSSAQAPSVATATTYVIPDGVKSIESGAFLGEDLALTELTIPDSVVNINGNLLTYSDKLKSVTIGSNLKDISWKMFYYCDGLSEINVAEDNAFYSSENGVLFDKEKTCLMLYPRQKEGTRYVVPSSVTKIGDGAFYCANDLTSVILPDCITEIGYYAFNRCGLTSISIPDGVTSIGTKAFESCEITSFVMPDSVSEIGGGVFKHCRSLESVELSAQITELPDGQEYGETEGSGFFFGCNSLTSIEIPDSVTSIGVNAFLGCTSLTEITIPDSVTSIEGGAFSDCTSLTSITIPDSVTSIANQAFEYCTSLTDVYYDGTKEEWNTIEIELYNDPLSNASIHCSDGEIASAPPVATDTTKPPVATDTTEPPIATDTTEIGKSGTYGDLMYTVLEDRTVEITDCDETVTEVEIPAEIEGMTVTSIGSWAFEDCTSLTEIIIPDSVTSIGDSAFSGTPWLAAKQAENPLVIVNGILIDGTACEGIVVIPDSVTSIGMCAFSNCTSLTEITIPESVTSIGYGAFDGCTSLTEITIPDSVTSIGNDVFDGCTSLTAITIPDSVTSIGDFMFVDCTGLTEITIPDGVTSIGVSAFNGCTSLTEVTIPDGVTGIGWYAFSGCTSLTAITIPDSVTSIGDFMFDSCTSLTEITIPDSMSSIARGAFSRCTSLTDVYYSGTEEAWNAIEFTSGNDDLLNATIHFNSTSSELTPSTGDIDGNNTIDANDAYFCLLAYAKMSVGSDSGLTDAQIQAADVDGNGTVDANDAYYILLYYAKKSVGQDVSWAELLG